MTYYDKKVVYLSYMEYGNKIKNAGFVKIENLNGNIKMDMRIANLSVIKDRRYDISVFTCKNKEYVIGGIYIHKGSGEWNEGLSLEKVGGKSADYSDLEKICIKISDSELIEGKIAKASTFPEKSMPKEPELKAGSIEKPSKPKLRVGSIKEPAKAEVRTKSIEEPAEPELRVGNIEEPSKAEVRTGSIEEPSKAEVRTGSIKEPAKSELKTGSIEALMKQINITAKARETEETDQVNTKPIKMENIILSDKWRQLMQVYPVVHPYEDNREYISIEPKDFVIMSGDYQHLANNSFLLHGFYNYRHIILGKEKESDNPEGSFYLGVPGVYYEREKMVALMFGFEAFECVGGKAEPGKFGYYLRKIKI